MLGLLLSALVSQLVPQDAAPMWGQSNAMLNTSTPAQTTTAAGTSCFWSGNVLVSTYMDIDTTTPRTCSPLIETTYEQPRAAMAEKFVADSKRPGLFVSSVAQGGQSYTALKSGTAQWNKMVTMLSAWAAMSSGGRIRGLVVHHGEQDDNVGNSRSTYKGYMVELQADATTLFRRFSFPIIPTQQFPVFMTQFSRFTAYGKTATTIAMAQVEAAKENTNRIVLVGPKYQYTYLDTVHLDAVSGRRMALKTGQALAYGAGWRPTWLESVTLSGTTVRACYHVPFPPLALDTTHASNAGNYGYQYACGSSPPAITGVAVFGVDCVDVTLASEPSPACQLDDKLNYAFDGTVSSRGNLRDSDPFGATHSSLYNWAVHEEGTVQ